MDTVKCPKWWLSYKGKCYRVSKKPMDFYTAKRWCEAEKASLASINDAAENNFMWRICHTEPDPITYPRNDTRTACWLGMREIPNTGDVTTAQADQKWEWLDGTTMEINKYQNWAARPGMGDGDGDGNRYFEPNNERTRRTPLGQDVRHAIMNQKEGGMSGKWYDKPAQFRAHAACEMSPERASLNRHAEQTRFLRGQYR